ncbi:Kv channel-interacting protein 4-like [Vanessa atalanta]|uniref:Kv channel-interacting protein 4-like n=1 Tax=Vanessa atalanta TaxID=42275 RepID=UPI001FCD32B2|nr:Kv channel-interacting protein 4-like [Vanessa atalanta]
METVWVRNTASSVDGRAGAGEAEAPPAPDAEAPARRRRHRPLYRRLFHYFRTAWTGVKFALVCPNINTAFKNYKQAQSAQARPLHVEGKEINKNVANTDHKLDSATKLNLLSDNIYRPTLEILNEVKVHKSNLVKSKKLEKGNKGKTAKKRVRFEDTELEPKQISFRERLVQFFHCIWTCTRTTVKIVLSLTARSENSELEELGEQLPRYRPDSIAALRRATRFTEPELKRLYRGFKAECPTGVVKEETFKLIYSQFFPQGANTAQYAHFVFNTLDQDRSGLLSFEEFVTGLSILSRGTLEEKLRWTFSLYDINGDGYITKEEMTEIVNAIYDLMGKIVEPMIDDEVVREKVERLFQKMDLNRDGVLTMDEFLDCCLRDEDITRSMGVFDSNF